MIDRHTRKLGMVGMGLAYLGGCQSADSNRCPPEPLAPQKTAQETSAPAAKVSGKSGDDRAAFIRSHYAKFEARIPMRDGAKLFTSWYKPIDASPNKKYPLLILRTPYSANPYGPDQYRGRLASEPLEREGFIFVWQDVRGRNASEGDFVNMRPHLAKKGPKDFDESTDTYDTIEWLTKNIRECNGKAGLVGTSYPGFYASAGAIDSHPALVATSPQAPIADWFVGDDMHRNGAFSLHLSFGFFAGFDAPRPKPIYDAEWKPFDMGTPDAYQFFLHAGPLAESEKTHFKGDRPFWHDIVTHPNYDDFWKSRNILPHLQNVKAATMVVGGWFDAEDLYGPLQTYKAFKALNPKTNHRLVMGPWRHGGWHRTKGDKLGEMDFGFETSAVFQEMELAFFKHHLKDGPNPRAAEATVFETGANRFRSFESWPPKTTKPAKLFLHPQGKLAFDAPNDTTTDEFISDPAKPVPYSAQLAPHYSVDYMAEDQRFVSTRPDVLVYQGPVLEQDLTLAGPLTADIWVSTTGTDADWIVKLVDEYPGKPKGKDDEDAEHRRGSEQVLVRGEPLRGRFRDSLETPKAFVPNEPTRVKFVLNDVFHTFKRGHRVMIQVQSTWFPIIDRNPQSFVPNIFEAKDSDYVKATHRVHRGKDMPSGLEVWILPNIDEQK